MRWGKFSLFSQQIQPSNFLCEEPTSPSVAQAAVQECWALPLHHFDFGGWRPLPLIVMFHARRLIILFEEDVSVYSWLSLLCMRCLSVKELKHTTLGFWKDASGKSTKPWCPDFIWAQVRRQKRDRKCTDVSDHREWHLGSFVANPAKFARLKESIEMKVPNAI